MLTNQIPRTLCNSILIVIITQDVVVKLKCFELNPIKKPLKQSWFVALQNTAAIYRYVEKYLANVGTYVAT